MADLLVITAVHIPRHLMLHRPKRSSGRLELGTGACTGTGALQSGNLGLGAAAARRRRICEFVCRARVEEGEDGQDEVEGIISKKAIQLVLWSMTGVYVLWLFILPFAPGDPVWAIKRETLSMLVDLSLNFFFVLPISNAAGFDLLNAPVVHPAAEALFNLVIGWTVMLGPLLFTDCRNNRFKGSLEALWLGQLFLTNTFLIPYMAIRLDEVDDMMKQSEATGSSYLYKLRMGMVSGAKVVAFIGGVVGVLSVVWGLLGRPEGGFGDITERWSFFLEYVRTDRVAYAFVWDLGLYSIFQPWLITNNIKNLRSSEMQQLVRALRFVPYAGLVAYLWGLSKDKAIKGLNEPAQSN